MEIKLVALPLSWLGLGGQRPHFPPPPHPTIQFDRLGGGSTQKGGTKFYRDLDADRRGCPTLSLKLGITGFTSLADVKWLCSQSTGAA